MKRPSLQQMLGLGVWAFSFGIALAVSLLLVFVVFDTSMERFGTSWFLLTFISIGFMILIPLDSWLGTKILPD